MATAAAAAAAAAAVRGRCSAAAQPPKLAPHVPHLNLVGRFWTVARQRQLQTFSDDFERFRAFSNACCPKSTKRPHYFVLAQKADMGKVLMFF